MKVKNSEKGIAALEIIISSAILLAVFLSLMAAYIFFAKNVLGNTEKIQAAYLLEEGMEALISMRDMSYQSNINSLEIDHPYYLAYDYEINNWSATTTQSVIDGIFIRLFSLKDVKRNGGGSIDVNGISDPKTKKIVVTVSWEEKGESREEFLEGYISDIFDN